MIQSVEEKLKKVLKDRNITARAKGLFAYLCVFEGERFAEMALKECKTTKQSYFQELKKSGYVVLSKRNGKGARWYIV